MSRLWTSGFETNNLTATEWVSVVGSPTIATSPVHSGTYALQLGNAQQTVDKGIVPVITSGTIWSRVYVYIKDGFGTSGSYQPIMRHLGASETCRADFRPTLQKFRLFNNLTSTAVEMAGTLSLNTWYRLELRVLLSDTVGEAELRIYVGDSTTALETLSLSGEDTLSTSFANVTFGNIIGANWAQGNVYIDDIAVNSSAGTFQNSWPGPGKIALLLPASDNSVTWERTGGAGSNAESVNDLPGTPSDATYNSEVVDLNSVDRLNVGSLPSEVPSNADILVVDLWGRIGSTQTSATNMRFKLWDESGTLTDGPTANANVNGWRVPSTGEHLVYDPGAKTKANIEAFDIGYENITDVATRERRVSALWANVEWLESVGVDTVALSGAWRIF